MCCSEKKKKKRARSRVTTRFGWFLWWGVVFHSIISLFFPQVTDFFFKLITTFLLSFLLVCCWRFFVVCVCFSVTLCSSKTCSAVWGEMGAAGLHTLPSPPMNELPLQP